MKNFKVGDVVMLASGGPKMTVSSEGETPGYVFCIWFDKSDRRGQEFLEETLIKQSSGPSIA